MPKQPPKQPNGTPGKKPTAKPVWLLLGLAAILLVAMTREAHGYRSPRNGTPGKKPPAPSVNGRRPICYCGG